MARTETQAWFARSAAALCLATLFLTAGAEAATTAPKYPDPKAMVIAEGPAGFAFTEGHEVPNAEVSEGANVEITRVVAWGRIGGYRVDFTSATGDGRVHDWASDYADADGASDALKAEAADAANGLVAGTPPLELGQETLYYSSPAGTPASRVASALAWRKGNVDAVLYVKGAPQAELLDLARVQDVRIPDPPAESATGTTASAKTATATTKNDFKPWLPIAIGVVLIAGVALVRRRRHV